MKSQSVDLTVKGGHDRPPNMGEVREILDSLATELPWTNEQAQRHWQLDQHWQEGTQATRIESTRQTTPEPCSESTDWGFPCALDFNLARFEQQLMRFLRRSKNHR